MSVRTDTVNLRVNISGDKARNELNLLQKKKAELRAEMRGLKKDTNDYKKVDKEFKSVSKEVERLQKEIGLTALTQKELNQQLKILRAQKANLVPDSKEFKRVQKEIERVSTRLREVRMGAHGFQGAMNSLNNTLKTFGTIAMSYLGLNMLTSQFRNLVAETAKYDDQLADIRKVTKMAIEDINELADALKNIDTRSSNEELREMAIAAGKLGIHGKEDLLGFVEAADQINVALGDDLPGSTEEIMKTIGKLVEIFHVNQDFPIGEAVLKVGSSMNELTNSSSASAGYIADFARRMGGVAPLVNMNIDEVMGLAATLDQLGQTAEVSSTALSKMFLKMASDADDFARYAGMEVDDFRNLLENDFTDAFVKVLKGVKDSSSGVNSLAATLGDLGMDAGRVVAVLGTLANNTEILENQMLMANIAFEEGTSVTEEFMVKNENFAATIDKLKKSFDELVTSTELRSFIQNLMHRVIALIENIKSLFKWINENRIAFLAFTTALIAQAGWVQRLTKFLALLTTGIKVQTVEQARLAISQSLLTARTQALTFAKSLLTLQFTKARKAFIALSAAMRLNPIALLAASVAAAIVAFNKFSNAVSETNEKLTWLREIEKEVQKELSETNAIQRTAINVLENKTSSIIAQERAIKSLIALNPDMLSGLTRENALTAEGTRLRDLYNKQLQETMRLRGVEARIKKHQERADVLAALEGDVDFALAGGAKGISFKDMPDDIKSLFVETSGTPFLTSLASNIIEMGAVGEKQLNNLKEILKEEQLKTAAHIDDALAVHEELSETAIQAQIQTAEQNIKTIQSTMNGLEEGSKEYILASQKLNKAIKELNRLQGIEEPEDTSSPDTTAPAAAIPDNKKLEDKTKQLESIARQIKELNLKIQEDRARAADDIDKLQEIEIQRMMDRYAALVKEAEQIGLDILQIEGLKEQELQNLRDKHFQEYTQREFQQQREFLDAYYKEQIDLAKQAYIEGAITLKEYNAQIESLRKQQLKDEATLYQDYASTVATAAEQLESAKTRILEEGVLHRKELTEEEFRNEQARLKRIELTNSIYSQERLKALEEQLELELQMKLNNEELTNEEIELLTEDFMQGIQDLRMDFLNNFANLIVDGLKQVAAAVSEIATIGNNKDQQAFNEEKIRSKKREEMLANQLDQGLISREEYDARIAKLNLEMDKKEQELREKQAKRDKRAAIFSALINTASAVIAGLNTQPFMPVGLAMGALAGVLGGLQIAAIKSEPVPVGKRGLVVDGPSHAAGGISMFNNQTGKQVAEIEGGEPVMVLSKNTYRNNKELIDKLLHASQYRNGAKVQMDQQFYNQQRPFKTNELLPLLKDGGFAFAASEMQRKHLNEMKKLNENKATPQALKTSTIEENDMDELIALNTQLYNLLIDNEENKEAQKSYVLFQDLKRKQDLYNKAKRSGGFNF